MTVMELIGTGWDVVVFNALGYFLVWKCFQVSKLRHQTVSEALEEQAVKLGNMNDTPEIVETVVASVMDNSHTEAQHKRLEEYDAMQNRAMEANNAGMTGFVNQFPRVANTVDEIGNTLAQQRDALQRVGEAYGELAEASQIIESVKDVAGTAANSAASNSLQLTEIANRAHSFESQVAAGMIALEATLNTINQKVDRIQEDI